MDIVCWRILFYCMTKRDVVVVNGVLEALGEVPLGKTLKPLFCFRSRMRGFDVVFVRSSLWGALLLFLGTTKKPLKLAFERLQMAGLAGIEPATPTLKVSCSTN